MSASTTLSILVPVYNEQYLVQPSLERLKILAESPLLDRIEIIVVDDGSTDNTAAVLREFENSLAGSPDPKLEWLFLRHGINQGKAAAIQTALVRANAELTVIRSEEHTSELQSRLHLVCRLLLEKKKDTQP